jgi:hypothetical protein
MVQKFSWRTTWHSSFLQLAQACHKGESIPGLVLGYEVVAMDSLILVFQDAEEVSPNGGQSPQGPVCTSVHSGPIFSLPSKLVLTDTPLDGQMAVKHVSPTHFRLLIN